MGRCYSFLFSSSFKILLLSWMPKSSWLTAKRPGLVMTLMAQADLIYKHRFTVNLYSLPSSNLYAELSFVIVVRSTPSIRGAFIWNLIECMNVIRQMWNLGILWRSNRPLNLNLLKPSSKLESFAGHAMIIISQNEEEICNRSKCNIYCVFDCPTHSKYSFQI